MAIEQAGNVAMFRFEAAGGDPDDLRVLRFRCSEGVSQLPSLDLELVSENHEQDLASFVGQSALLTIDPGNGLRHLSGIVASFEQGAVGKRFSRYYARVVPKVWLLHHRSNIRIFQEKSVPDIVAAVLEDAEITTDTFDFRCQSDYKAREYCVQYRESDWDFISRLLEDEGIFYFFEHTDQGHKLVFGDSTSAHNPIEGGDSGGDVPFRPPSGVIPDRDYIATFRRSESVRSGASHVSDFSFKAPKVDLLGQVQAADHPKLRIYDNASSLQDSSVIERIAKVRLEEQGAKRVVANGSGVCHRMAPGYRYELTEHPRDAFNGEYLVTDLLHEGHQPQILEEEAPDREEGNSYSNEFRCIPGDVVFRPARVTPQPYIRGTQSATVVGPSGEEIYCDEYGRVKVQFHWDEQGENNESSSCWVRVSQQWAGGGYGFQTIPRIGNEVVLAFFEGNPDQPHIIGRVYNAQNMPPYSLPDNKTQTGIKTETSMGGGGSNEIRFEDAAGSEELYVQAQKDQNILVKNDKSEQVGNDESTSIGANRTVSVGENHSESVGGEEELNVTKSRSRGVGEDESVTIGGSQTVAIEASMSLTVGEDVTETFGAAHTVEVASDYTKTIGGAREESVADTYTLQAKKIALVAQDELSITVGSAELVMKKNGDITLDGKKINVKGSGDVIIKGSKVKAN